MDMKTVMEGYGIAPLPKDAVEAMAYVPFQPYAPEMCKAVLGYENGTMFRALHKPFYGNKCGGAEND
ncbi:spore coat associated protein CotJA [Ruminococcus sp.]|uniref:spore coat associated protein CotJA n=1 Tax=Ruminococcus sp. TaxID=41978 RepID=UPI002930C4A2|nr:spore coat associated protein CotJA [uncultured Ruminococcus sp.]